MKDRLTPLSRIYRLKLLLLGVLLICLGLGVGYFSTYLPTDTARPVTSFLDWLSNLLVLGGGLGVLTDVITGRQKERADLPRSGQ